MSSLWDFIYSFCPFFYKYFIPACSRQAFGISFFHLTSSVFRFNYRSLGVGSHSIVKRFHLVESYLLVFGLGEDWIDVSKYFYNDKYWYGTYFHLAELVRIPDAGCVIPDEFPIFHKPLNLIHPHLFLRL